MIDNSEVLHFFSLETKVSLELPVGWEDQEEDGGLAIYYYEMNDDEEESNFDKCNPRLIIKTFAIPTNTPDALKNIADSTVQAYQIQRQILERSVTEVDSYPAIVNIFTYQDDEMSCTFIQYQVFVQISQIICSISGVVELQYQQEFLPVFEQAVKSIRFIPV